MSPDAIPADGPADGADEGVTVLHVGGASPYDVAVGTGLAGRLPQLLGESVQRVGVVFPEGLLGLARPVLDLLAGSFEVLALPVPDGERAKTVSVAAVCWEELGEAGFTRSDEWVSVLIDGYYRSTLGRAPDPGGRAHWIATIKAGMKPADVAARFYASAEYFQRSGGTNEAWVTDLYAEDADGNVWWFGSQSEDDPGAGWLAGEDGAEAGLAMAAEPRRGDGYRRAEVPGEDLRAEVVEVDATTVLVDTYDGGEVTVQRYTRGAGLEMIETGTGDVLLARQQEGE